MVNADHNEFARSADVRTAFGWVVNELTDGRVVEAVSIGPQGQIAIAHFATTDASAFAGFVFQHDGRANVYLALNAISGALAGSTRRAKASDVPRHETLLLDVDPDRDDLPQRRALLAAIGMLPRLLELSRDGERPLLVDSGRGAQVWLRTAAEPRQAWEQIRAEFAQLLSRYECRLDSTSDAVRLARVPGSVNLKTGRVARIIPIPGNLPPRLTETLSGQRHDLNDLSRSGFEMAAANALAKFKFSATEVEEMLKAYPFGRGEAEHSTSRRTTVRKAVGQHARKRSAAPKAKNENEAAEKAPAPEETKEAESMLSDPGLLKRLLDDIAGLGVAGEEENCTTIELTMVSALGERPINLTVKGESSSGKNFLLDMVASLHPPNRVKRLTRISAKALYYLPENLSHKILIFAEVNGAEDADYSIREIESSGALVMLVTEKKEGQFEATEKRVKGPVAIINTTTRAHLNAENETRHFEIATDETEEQTGRIFREQARLYEDPAVELRRSATRRRWQIVHALLKPLPVLIPFASRIAEKVPRKPVRMRRDYPRVLVLIAASALLHQRQREHKVVEGKEHLVASLDDYKIARELAEPMLRRAMLGMTDRCVELIAWLRQQGKAQPVAATARGLGWTWRTAKKYLEEGETLGIVEGIAGRYRAATDIKPPGNVLPEPETLLSVSPRAEAAQREQQNVNPSGKKGFRPSSTSFAASAPEGRDGRA